MFGQITFGDRLRRIAKENGERELGRYRYNRLSEEGKNRHAEISKEIEAIHAEYEQLLKEKRFEEAMATSAREMNLWSQMTDLVLGKEKGA